MQSGHIIPSKDEAIVYATTMTYMASEKFKSLNLNELRDFDNAKSFKDLDVLWNIQCEYVIQSILSANDKMKAVEGWLWVAKELTHMNNFFSADAVFKVLKNYKIEKIYLVNNVNTLQRSAKRTFNELAKLYPDIMSSNVLDMIKRVKGPKMGNVSAAISIVSSHLGGVLDNNKLTKDKVDKVNIAKSQREEMLAKNTNFYEKVFNDMYQPYGKFNDSCVSQRLINVIEVDAKPIVLQRATLNECKNSLSKKQHDWAFMAPSVERDKLASEIERLKTQVGILKKGVDYYDTEQDRLRKQIKLTAPASDPVIRRERSASLPLPRKPTSALELESSAPSLPPLEVTAKVRSERSRSFLDGVRDRLEDTLKESDQFVKEPTFGFINHSHQLPASVNVTRERSRSFLGSMKEKVEDTINESDQFVKEPTFGFFNHSHQLPASVNVTRERSRSFLGSMKEKVEDTIKGQNPPSPAPVAPDVSRGRLEKSISFRALFNMGKGEKKDQSPRSPRKT